MNLFENFREIINFFLLLDEVKKTATPIKMKMQ